VTDTLAKKYNYLQVRETDFEKAVQNPVQQPAVSPRTDSQVGWGA
jgi:hypothetical protein